MRNRKLAARAWLLAPSQLPGRYPPDKQEKETQTVLEQAKLLCAEWAGRPHYAFA
jgi:hypothetical protein